MKAFYVYLYITLQLSYIIRASDIGSEWLAKYMPEAYSSYEEYTLTTSPITITSIEIHYANKCLKPSKPESAEKAGYNCESHHVTTRDGYILTLHRISSKGRTTGSPVGSPVLLQHGLTTSSWFWLTQSPPNSSLAFMLADAGYDVWLGNYRGNTYSRNHTNLDPEKPKFWDFSFHEMGIYDLPAMIDYILDCTSSTQIHYVGHSMGTTGAFVMLSEKPEYNEKIYTFTALAPVAYMPHSDSPFFAALAPLCQPGMTTTAVECLMSEKCNGEFLPPNKFILDGAAAMCSPDFSTIFCSMPDCFIGGCNWNQINPDVIPYIYGHFTQGTSTKSVAHYALNYNSRKFAQFDYGPTENWQRYRSISPPGYGVENINCSMHWFYGLGDLLADEDDILPLASRTGSRPTLWRMDDEHWSHSDFGFGRDASTLVYAPIIDILSPPSSSAQ